MTTNQKPDTTSTPTLRVLPAPVLDYEEYRDRKRIDREDRLDRFEQDCDYRSRSPWP